MAGEARSTGRSAPRGRAAALSQAGESPLTSSVLSQGAGLNLSKLGPPMTPARAFARLITADTRLTPGYGAPQKQTAAREAPGRPRQFCRSMVRLSEAQRQDAFAVPP